MAAMGEAGSSVIQLPSSSRLDEMIDKKEEPKFIKVKKGED